MEDWNSWNEGIHPVRSPSAERERRIARLQREKKERDERIKMIDYPHSYLGTMGHTTAPDVSPFLEEHTASSRAKIRGIDPNSIPSYRRYDYGGYRSSKYDKYDRLDKYDKYDRFNKYDTYDKSGKSYFHGDDNVRHGPYDKYDRYYDEMYGSKPGHGSRYDYDYEFDDVDEDVPRRHGYRSATALELDAADGEIDGKFYGKPIVERSVPSPVDRNRYVGAGDDQYGIIPRIMGRRGRVAEYPEYDTPTRYGGGYASSYTDSYTYSRDDDQVGARRHYGAVDLDMPRSYYSDSVGRVRDDWHYEGSSAKKHTGYHHHTPDKEIHHKSSHGPQVRTTRAQQLRQKHVEAKQGPSPR
jgi:hypothetical protein